MSDPELAAGSAADDRAPGSGQRAARARKLAADLRGTPDDILTAPWGSGRGERVSAALSRAAALFERGELAQGEHPAAAATVALSAKAHNARAHARVHEANARSAEGAPFASLADNDARAARETAARLEWQARRARQLAAPPGEPTARPASPRETAPGTGPLAGIADAARRLAAAVRESPVQGTYFTDRHFPDLVPADTRHMASTELEFAAARFDRGNEMQGREHLGNARHILASRSVAASRGGWERINDASPSPGDFQAEAFHHANRAGMIEDDLNASRISLAGGTETGRAEALGPQSALWDFSPPVTTVTPRPPGRRAGRSGRTPAARAPRRGPSAG